MGRFSVATWCVVGLLAGLPAGGAEPGPAQKSGQAQSSDQAQKSGQTHASDGAGCLASGDGYLRARIRGTFNLDIDFHNNELECDGGPRPDGSGIRVSFAGPRHSDGRRMRMVFGVRNAKEGTSGRELPTNLTVIFEGEERLFATRGDDHCTVDRLQQERLGALGGPRRSYRIVASGFCISPASSLSGADRILVTRFDFAGHATFEDEKP